MNILYRLSSLIIICSCILLLKTNFQGCVLFLVKSFKTIKRFYYIMAYSKIVYLYIFTVIDEYQLLVKLLKNMSWLVFCFKNDSVVDMDVELFKSIILAVKNYCVVYSKSVFTQHACCFVWCDIKLTIKRRRHYGRTWTTYFTEVHIYSSSGSGWSIATCNYSVIV